MRIVRAFRFEASHSLPHHDGACRHLHGHSYRLEIELEGKMRPVDPQDPQSGFVVDFGRLHQVVERELIQPFLDHRHLNDSIPNLPYPSAEHLALWILTWCAHHLDGRPELGDSRISRIRLWETERAWVEVDRSELTHLP
ncbi:MAG: 6-carboxytetrahydropterin synthase [Magnetococcales bacterium]|nr:6-carboxytetrahydropterin synthase [Magnetococcales bacterium]NGZ28277.1 6-carboxytetrahydropterin synthase [Magnetococcales bacterium]